MICPKRIEARDRRLSALREAGHTVVAHHLGSRQEAPGYGAEGNHRFLDKAANRVWLQTPIANALVVQTAAKLLNRE